MLVLALQSLGTSLLLYIVLNNLGIYHFDKLYMSLAVLVTTLILVAVYTSDFPNDILANSLIICFASIFLIWKTKEVLLNICFSILSMIILLISHSISNFIFSFFAKNDLESIGAIEYCIILALLFAISYFVSKYLGRFIQRGIKALSTFIDKKYIAFILSGLLMSLIFFYLNFFYSQYLADLQIDMLVNATLNVFYFAILISAIYIFFVGIRNHMDNIHKQELLEIQRNYITNLESLYGDMREFRHNYINIVAAMYGYLQDKDYDGLNDYFTGEIVPIKDRMQNANHTLDQLKNIHIPEIKGTVALKLMHAQDNGIRVEIAVKDVVDSIGADIMDITNVLGILLDNAEEACAETDEPYIKFVIRRENDVVEMFIANPVLAPLPPIDEMFKKGFSTKGEGRGLGLDTVNQIMDKDKNTFLITNIRNNEFVQEIRSSSRKEGDN